MKIRQFITILLILIVVLGAWGYHQLMRPGILPIKHVVISGNYQFVLPNP